MGDVYVALGMGGSGADLDAITAGAGDVLSGKVTVDREGEPIMGTLTLSGTADAAKVLSGYTFYNTDAKSRLTGTLQITSVVSFNVAQYSNLTLIASWAKPSKGPWSGVRVICKQGSYPTNVNDGTLFYEGSGTSATKSLAAGTWYFRAWNYIATNTGRMYGSYVDKTVTNNQIKGQQVFTSSGTFVVPNGVYKVDVFCVGGGGHGRNGQSGGSGYNPAGGGGGGYTNTGSYSVSPGQSFSVVIGAGGAGGASYTGGSTAVGSLLSSAGGKYTGAANGGDGGSGGGEPGFDKGADGGSDGSKGGGYYGGAGQGRTTRAFGESSGTLYAGGGGGGSSYGTHGRGGAGGGGNGGGGGGSANTGGGGGGGKGANSAMSSEGGNGGSGIAIIRWGY